MNYNSEDEKGRIIQCADAGIESDEYERSSGYIIT